MASLLNLVLELGYGFPEPLSLCPPLPPAHLRLLQLPVEPGRLGTVPLLGVRGSNGHGSTGNANPIPLLSLCIIPVTFVGHNFHEILHSYFMTIIIYNWNPTTTML